MHKNTFATGSPTPDAVIIRQICIRPPFTIRQTTNKNTLIIDTELLFENKESASEYRRIYLWMRARIIVTECEHSGLSSDDKAAISASLFFLYLFSPTSISRYFSDRKYDFGDGMCNGSVFDSIGLMIYGFVRNWRVYECVLNVVLMF